MPRSWCRLCNQAGDCDDGDAAINPGATEVCDGADNDCDGLTDEGVTKTFYRDADEDSYGDAAVTTQACTPPYGYVTNSTDCDDTRNTVYPGASEICDGLDNDCDGVADESLTFITYYTDADGDGYGTGSGQSLCNNPGAGYATQAGDCNDGNLSVNPGRQETPNNSIDDDCDGLVGEGGIIVCTIQVSPNPTVVGQAHHTIFRGYGPQTVTLTGTISGGVGPYTYSWGAAGTGNPILVSPIVTTVYKLTVTDGNGFTTTCTVTIAVIDARCGIKNDKVLVCHNATSNWQNICMSPNAVAVHLTDHGDYLGSCTQNAATSKPGSGLQQQMMNELAVKLFPNPVNKQLYLQLPTELATTNVQINLYDANGRLVKKIENANRQQLVSINIAGLASGLYFLDVRNSKGYYSRHKVVMQH